MVTEYKLPVVVTKISQSALLVTVWVLFGITTILLISRFAIRIWLHNRLFWDDLFAGLAFLLLLAHNVLATLVAPSVYMLVGAFLGEPLPMDFLEQIAYLAKTLFISNLVFIICLWSVKASLLALLWRLVRQLPPFRRAWFVITAITAVGGIITLILAPVACSDLSALGCNTAKNIRMEAVSLRFTTASDIVSDLLLMSLPVAFILTSSLPLSQKLGLCGLFLLGFTVIAMSILRIVVNDSGDRHTPPSWLLFWNATECTVAVMVSCVASFKSLFTNRKRPSTSKRYAYVSDSTGKPVSIGLRSLNRYDPTASANQGQSSTLVVPGKTRNNDTWKDDDSREEILHRTDFEVRYDRASVSDNRFTALPVVV